MYTLCIANCMYKSAYKHFLQSHLPAIMILCDSTGVMMKHSRTTHGPSSQLEMHLEESKHSKWITVSVSAEKQIFPFSNQGVIVPFWQRSRTQDVNGTPLPNLYTGQMQGRSGSP